MELEYNKMCGKNPEIAFLSKGARKDLTKLSNTAQSLSELLNILSLHQSDIAELEALREQSSAQD
jgi:hypothetical protein